MRAEPKWWVQNIHLNYGRLVTPYLLRLIIPSDASFKGWGAFCQWHETGGHWTLLEKKDSIDVLEMTAAKYTMLSFTRLYPTAKTVQLKMNNTVALSYLVKIGGTRNQVLAQISKEIWKDLLDKGVTGSYCRMPSRIQTRIQTSGN